MDEIEKAEASGFLGVEETAKFFKEKEAMIKADEAVTMIRTAMRILWEGGEDVQENARALFVKDINFIPEDSADNDDGMVYLFLRACIEAIENPHAPGVLERRSKEAQALRQIPID